MDLRRPTRRSKSYSFSDTISDNPPPLPRHPFSWEQFPGIPKNNTNKNDDISSQNLLPLPPSSHAVNQSPAIKKYASSRSFRNDDPFLAAFVECSKDKYYNKIDGGSKNSKRLISDGSGFVVSMYSSCKRTCAVSESIVYRRRSATGYILTTDEDLTVGKSKP